MGTPLGRRELTAYQPGMSTVFDFWNPSDGPHRRIFSASYSVPKAKTVVES
jgi:hypothetical protein